MILYLLWDSPSYGYEISKKISELTQGMYNIKETTLYSAFKRMEKDGLVTSFYQSSESGKRRTYYQITDAGRLYYQNKCDEWQVTKDVVEHFVRKE